MDSAGPERRVSNLHSNCAYYIYKGEDPDFDSEGGHGVEGFPIFGPIIRRCWDRGYPSIMAVKHDVGKGVEDATAGEEGPRAELNTEIMKTDDFDSRVQECREYLLRCSQWQVQRELL